MKIIVVTQEDPFYLPIFFRRLFDLAGRPENTAWLTVAGVVIQLPLGNRSLRTLIRRMYGLYGPWWFLVKGVGYTWRKLLEGLRRLGLPVRGFGVRWMAAEAGVPVLEQADVNTVAFARLVESKGVDLIVSAAASQIFKARILHTPPKGCINLHNAPLPRYRGMLPNFWQLYHGEEYSVLTIHEMTERLDKGRIILQRKTRIEPQMSLEELIKLTKNANADALMDALRMLEDGHAEYTDPPAEKGSYFTFPTRREVKEFRRRGHRVV